MPNQPHHENQPRTVQDIIRVIETKSADGGYIYRGERRLHKEPPYHGKVSSNLWREYGIEDEHFNIEIIQKEMLNGAKKHTGHLPWDFRADLITFPNLAGKGPDEVIDFEILTEIQHYGGKTNLIDFTTDYFIALFFACDGYFDQDGRVILQKIDLIRHMIAQPQNPRHRVIAQKSVFVRPPRGFIEPDENNIVTIPANLKESLLQHLQNYHGISTETIYNDLHGFIRNQDLHGDAYTHFYRGFACANRKEHEKSIEYYTKAIELKPDFMEAYNNRGNAYEEKGESDKAIENFTKAIELNPDYAEAYSNRSALLQKQR